MQREEEGDKGDTKIYCCNNFFILFFFIYIYIFSKILFLGLSLNVKREADINWDFYC